MPSTLSSPIDLRKKTSPVVIIYGDDENQAFTRKVWDMIPNYNVVISAPQSLEALYDDAYNSAVVFVIVNDADDENLRIAEELSKIKGVVADIIAITKEPDIRKRLHILSAKYDAIYNLDIIDSGDFAQIFHHKLKKGIMRLKARLQEDEYQVFLGFLAVSADAFIVFDTQKRIFYVSEHYLKLYPNSREMFVRGTPVQRVFEAIAAEMGVGQHDPRYQNALDFWGALKGQFEFRLDNGTHLRMTAVELPHGQGTIVSTTNITTYKEQEFALEQQQIALERALSAEQEASALQKQFISMVSHEFRTPLAIVDGNAQILQRLGHQMSEEDMKQRLKTIRSAVSRTVNMMEAVLSSNLLKTGKLDLNIETFDICELVGELCEEQANLARGHKIHSDIQVDDPMVRLDKKFATIILTNLLSNAVKFTQEDIGEIFVKIRSRPEELFIQVWDNGVGIPEEELSSIFQRYYRASTSSGIPGSGVGLALTRELVLLHRGKIFVQSQLGQGTCFTLTFPQVSSNRQSNSGESDFSLEQQVSNQ